MLQGRAPFGDAGKPKRDIGRKKEDTSEGPEIRIGWANDWCRTLNGIGLNLEKGGLLGTVSCGGLHQGRPLAIQAASTAHYCCIIWLGLEWFEANQR